MTFSSVYILVIILNPDLFIFLMKMASYNCDISLTVTHLTIVFLKYRSPVMMVGAQNVLFIANQLICCIDFCFTKFWFCAGSESSQRRKRY